MAEIDRHLEHTEPIQSSEHDEASHDNTRERPEHGPQPAHREVRNSDNETLRKSIEKLAASGQDLQIAQKEFSEPSHTAHHLHANRNLKMLARERTLASLRKRLPAADRFLSNFIHREAIDFVSERASKTIARPIPTLLAGVFAFLGTLIFFLGAKRYGFAYKPTTLLLLFISGVICGLIIEIVVRLIIKVRR